MLIHVATFRAPPHAISQPFKKSHAMQKIDVSSTKSTGISRRFSVMITSKDPDSTT